MAWTTWNWMEPVVTEAQQKPTHPAQTTIYCQQLIALTSVAGAQYSIDDRHCGRLTHLDRFGSGTKTASGDHSGLVFMP